MGWLTPTDERLPGLWPGSVDIDPDDLAMFLNTSRIQCEAFAPKLRNPEDPPDNYLFGQAMQARALARAGVAGGGDAMGGYGDTVTVFPMDWAVKNVLRPKRGKPVIR